MANFKKGESIVVTNDDDLLQLLYYCHIWNPRKKKFTDEASFEDEFGITPDQWPIVKSLAGCTSDNVAGIKNVGLTTAIQYLTGVLTKGTRFDAIEKNKNKMMETNIPLVELPFKGVGVFKINFDEEIDFNNFIDVCDEYGFKSFLRKEEIKIWKNALHIK